MVLSLNEIRSRAYTFAKEWENECSENAEAKSFWDGFFHVFGISRRRIASFEEPVKKLGNKQGFVDLLWKGTLLVEHKSRGRSLDKAYSQALDYFEGIKERDLPKYVLVSDFERFRLYDLRSGEQTEFKLKDLPKNIQLFNFVSGYGQQQEFKPQDPVNVKAAEHMGKLHDAMKDAGYTGHKLELYLVRLLFCLFAEDTGIFNTQQLQQFIVLRTEEDGSNLGAQLSHLFQVLNTPRNERMGTLDESLANFAYINGKLFEEPLPLPSFDSNMRSLLLSCCALDWQKISPAIFGSMFQSIMNQQERRTLGAHYTSEENILKVISPLFLDELYAEFEKIGNNKKRLTAFQEKLRGLTFLDPACGCGNFLVIAYRELRLLELEVLKRLYPAGNGGRQGLLDINSVLRVNVDQFYGIEIEEFPAQIAQVALWLVDHQVNELVSREFGMYCARIPLKASGNIVCGNALTLDWKSVIYPSNLSYIFGNPPFVGAKYMSEEQRESAGTVMHCVKNGKTLDFVASWFVKSILFIRNTHIKVSLVSTNSICQGEQVSPLWDFMHSMGAQIFFAYRTFKWSNEGKKNAAVHCVIVGFASHVVNSKRIFDTNNTEIKAKNINGYLVDARNLCVKNRTRPLCNRPHLGIGNKPIDGGNYLFSTSEMNAFLSVEPDAKPYFRKWIGASEFLNGKERWCLWLGECTPTELKVLPECQKIVSNVKKFRELSKSKPTQNIAATPTRFHVENIPANDFLVIPRVSSERRKYIPIGFESSETMASDAVLIAGGADLYYFGLLSSIMHNSWMRTVAGRLKSDYRYSVGVVYNNYPFPVNTTQKQRDAISKAAHGVLDARGLYPESTLANLYDPLLMPAELVKAHEKLDKAVDKAYRGRAFNNEAERVAFLFDLYAEITGE